MIRVFKTRAPGTRAAITDEGRLPRGLPDRLPEGERLLWQGAPDWRQLSRHLFNVRVLAIYFAVLVTICAAIDVTEGLTAQQTLASSAKLGGAALGALGFLVLYAWLISKATVYSITSERVVIQLGLAVPMAINLPFRKIDTAALKQRTGGFGDVSLLLNVRDRLAYFIVWPHARPWRMAHAEPTLRCIPDAARVGQILARAMAAHAGVSAPAAPELRPAAVPASGAVVA